MDKQSLKKHHFWILLAVAVVLIPVVLSGAVFGVGSAAGDKMKDIVRKQNDLNKASPKSQLFLEELDKQKVELEKRRREVWQLAYAAQVGLICWPETLKEHDNDPFGDQIPENDRERFRHNNVYFAELYEPMPAIMAPTEFANRSWTSMRHVAKWNELPTNEEVWLALEDVCVERQVLRDIRAVNQMLAEFLEVPHSLPAAPTPPIPNASEEVKAEFLEKKKDFDQQKTEYDREKLRIQKELREAFKVKDDALVGRFLSPYWQLDLSVARPATGRSGDVEVRYKLKNISPRRQNIARIEFKIHMRDPSTATNEEAVVLPVEAEYLSAGADYPPDAPFTTARPKGVMGPRIFKVEQKLDLRYAPVKRVDRLELGYPAHRFANRQLVPSSFSQKEMANAPAASGQSTDPAGATVDPGSGGKGGDTAAASVNVTANGVQRLRYLDRTDQVRRMPVGLVLVVDQAHVQDVLRAFANSRLRFQDTQFHWQRFRGTINLNAPAVMPGPSGPPPPGGGGGETSGGRGGRSETGQPPQPPPTGGFGGRGGFPIPGMPGAGDPNVPPNDEGVANLVELSIYGLVSLYERYPPKDQAPAATPTSAPGTATPPPAPPTPGVPQPPPPAGMPQPPPPGPGGGGS